MIAWVATHSLRPEGIHMGVWQPYHGRWHNHHAIILQPNCMMLG